MLKWCLAALAAAFFIYLFWLPWVPALKDHNPKTTSLMQLREAQAKAKGKKLKSVMRWMPLTQMSPHLPHAALLAEDDTFYQHSGFDLQQIKIAIELNWRKKRWVYGASTITQQLARTLYLSPRKNLLRKAKEAVITAWLEHELSKQRILEIYLNVIEWGPGIYGAEAAAQHYFQTSAADLTPDEAIALVSILPSPRRWSPFSERAFMSARRTNLLERMRRAGYIPEEELQEGATLDSVTDSTTTFTTLETPDVIPLESAPSVSAP